MGGSWPSHWRKISLNQLFPGTLDTDEERAVYMSPEEPSDGGDSTHREPVQVLQTFDSDYGRGGVKLGPLHDVAQGQLFNIRNEIGR